MAFAHHPGLRSIGNLAIVGLACTWVTALVLLPALDWREAHHSLDAEDDESMPAPAVSDGAAVD